MSLSRSSVALALSFGASTSALAHQIPNLPDVVESVMPSVVRITCKANDPVNPNGKAAPSRLLRPGTPDLDKSPSMGQGTGIVMDSAKGYIITNDHVAGDCSEIKIIPHGEGQKPIFAILVGTDKLTDIAVLQIPSNSRSMISQAKLGNSDNLRLGENVFAIGHPFGLTETVTLGIVSGKNRDADNKPYGNLIQTDAAVNPGNSGGPLFNADGEVIAINNMIFSRTGQFGGITFSIPINQAKLVAYKLVEQGRVPWGYMGASISSPSEENAAKAKRSNLKGVWVEAVDPNGAAAGSLKSGDIVLTANGKSVNQPSDLARCVGETMAGNKIKLEVWRDGRIIGTELTLKPRPDLKPSP